MTHPVLANIAARLGRKPQAADTLEHRFQQLKATADAPVHPAMPEDPQAFFRHQADRNLFEITEVTNLDTALAALPATLPLALSPQPEIRKLSWQQAGFTLTENIESPALAVVQASYGLAETGTVVVDSATTPSRLLFLAEELLVILDTHHILPVQEDLWRRTNPGHQRALHLISGPSRTADVEQTLQVGAHGPRRVHLWLLHHPDT